MIRTRFGRQARCVGEGGARGRTCNPLPGGFGHQSLGTRTGARGARWTQGQAGAGNTRSKEGLPSATSQETWPEAEPRTTTRPLGENRGGTPIDVLPPPIPSPAQRGRVRVGAAAGPDGPGRMRITSVGVLLPISFVFFVARVEPTGPARSGGPDDRLSETRERNPGVNPGFRFALSGLQVCEGGYGEDIRRHHPCFVRRFPSSRFT
jgi:hypothetical protein